MELRHWKAEEHERRCHAFRRWHSQRGERARNWEVVKDDATGTPYWWNVKTNKTTWEQPAGAPDAALV